MKKIIFLIIGVLSSIISLTLYSIYTFTSLFDNIFLMDIYIYSTLIFGNLILIISLLVFYHLKYQHTIKNLQNRLLRWSKLSPRVNQIGEDAFQTLPVGIIVLDDEATEIGWVNSYAKTLFNRELVETNLREVSESLAEYVEEGNFKSITIALNERMVDVIYRSEYQVLYLFNVTERENVKKEYTQNLPALGIINLDNLEDTIENLDIAEQSLIRSEYLTVIDEWIETHQGFIKPISEERLLMFVKRRRLEDMILKEFDLLNRIREISLNHDIVVSLSMGIASWDLEFDELANYAQNAIDLAERRGGDQVVVNIEGEKIKYFGARSEALSKVSRTNVKQIAQSLQRLFDKSDTLFIMGHDQLDMDSFASMIAIYRMSLTAPDIVSYLVIDEERIDQTVTEVFNYLKENNHFILKQIITTKQALEKSSDNKLLVIVDTQLPNIVHSQELLDLDATKVIIDHHRGSENSIEADLNYIDSSASSTIELLIELIGYFNRDIEIDYVESSIMYGGLLVDTNNFTYRTSVRTFEVASKLREYDADPLLTKTWLRNDLSHKIDLNNMLSNVEIFLDRFAIVKSERLNQPRSFIAQVSEALLEIRNIDAAFTINKLDKDYVGISARSYGEVNVQLIMEQLGGGGHLTSAATQIKDEKINDVYEKLKQILEFEYGGESESMKVILIEDVKGKGKKGEVVEVKSGYANYLISSNLGIPANPENMKKLEEDKKKAQEAEAKHLELIRKIASDIEGKSINLTILVGADGKRFGSITPKQIVEEFQKEHGVTIDRKKLELKNDLISAGIYPVGVALDKGVKATFEVNVIEKRD